MKIMRTIIISLLTLALTTKMIAQNSNKVINIISVMGVSNHFYPTLIGSDSTQIQRVIMEDNMNQSLNLGICLVRPSAVEYITKYICRHCDTINHINYKSKDYFIIYVYTKTSVHKCYIMEKAMSKPYFEGLIKWIENSPYKKECKKIIEDIRPYAR